jgi:predicted DNA-binding transcriptional regulator YafY
VSDTAGRLLTLLSLLQMPHDWSGPELARRLEVSERTVRNDVQRLRDLGYPVRATRGAVGGYRLAAGTAMPPLLLDDEEAVAIAVSLRSANDGTVAGLEQSSHSALIKLQQVLPARLAARVDAFRATMLRVGPRILRYGHRSSERLGGQVDGAVLAMLAAAGRDREIVRFAYVDHGDVRSERRIEPYRLVSMGQRWYHVAFDVRRQDWRTFRVDRMDDVRSVGHRFRERELPTQDVAAYVAARTHQVQMRVRGTVIVRAPIEVVREHVGWWGDGTVEELDDSSCRLGVGGTSPESLAFWLGVMDADFEIVDSPELAEAVRRLAQRYARAV